MGRIKTKQIKRITHELMEKHGQEFSESFQKNKELVEKRVKISSKKLKNVIAGYATRIKKKGRRARGYGEIYEI